VLGHHVKVQTRKHFEHDTKRWARRMRIQCGLLAVRYLLGAHSGFAAWTVVVSNLLADDYEVLLLGTSYQPKLASLASLWLAAVWDA